MKLLKAFENFKEDIDIELEDFLGKKFKLDICRISGAPIIQNGIFNRDEIEIIIEDFEKISKIHDLKLISPFKSYPGPDNLYIDIGNFWTIEVRCNYRNFVIYIEIYNEYYDEEFIEDINIFINQQRNMGFKVELVEHCEESECNILIYKDDVKYIKSFESILKENYNGIDDIVLKDYEGNSFNIIGRDTLLPKELLPIGKYTMPFNKDEVEMIIEDFNVIADMHNLRMVDYSGRYVDTDDTYFIGLFFDFYQYKKYYIHIEIETDNYDEDLRSDIHSFITQQNNMGYSIDTESDENDNVSQILIFKKEDKVMKHLEKYA